MSIRTRQNKTRRNEKRIWLKQKRADAKQGLKNMYVMAVSIARKGKKPQYTKLVKESKTRDIFKFDKLTGAQLYMTKARTYQVI